MDSNPSVPISRLLVLHPLKGADEGRASQKGRMHTDFNRLTGRRGFSRHGLLNDSYL